MSMCRFILSRTHESELTRTSCAALLLTMVWAMSGCHQDMTDQPKKEALEASVFFEDGRTARPLVPGTIARGHLETETPLFTGKSNGQLVAELPVPLTAELVERGRKQFSISCVPCHGKLGDGDGIIVARGLKRPSSFHVARLRGAPVGYFFDVISNGFGAMPSYRNRIAPDDRWAVAAYVRALQFSQFAPADVLSPAELEKLNLTAGGKNADPRQ